MCVRKRPLSKAELMGNEEDVVMVTDKNTVVLTAPKLAVDLTKYTQKVQCPSDHNGMIKLFASFISMGTVALRS